MNEQNNLGVASSNAEPAGWEREMINKLLLSALTEQRRARRWSIVFKSLGFLYLFGLLVMYFSPRWHGFTGGDKHTALVELRGMIAADQEANADTVIAGLRAAFKDKNTKGVIIRVNSPGGSPVQSGYINDEIFRLRAENPNVPLYAVVTDICASGAYYIASAAKDIYVDKASLVGSIGVVMEGFGFVDAMSKLGVERRIWTAGKHKGMLDPFSPLKPDDVNHIHAVLGDVHQQFIDQVKKGRGDRIKGDESIFSGLVWTGQQSLELGLTDALGSSSKVAREVVGAENIVDFTVRDSVVDRFAKRLGTAVVGALGPLGVTLK
jgi:protease IV